MRTSEEIRLQILDTYPDLFNLMNEYDEALCMENDEKTYEKLKKSLTFAESDALDKIISKICRQGIISINSLSKDTGISRPVFNNLLNKLEDTNMAIVNNMGAKGTHIKFINNKLLQERAK